MHFLSIIKKSLDEPILRKIEAKTGFDAISDSSEEQWNVIFHSTWQLEILE